MKSNDQVWFGIDGTCSGVLRRSGNRRLARRFWLRFIAQYTRHTRLWFQLKPNFRSLWKYFQKPQRGCFSSSLLSASITGASRSSSFSAGSSRYQALRDRPTEAQAFEIDSFPATTSWLAAQRRWEGFIAFPADPWWLGSPMPYPRTFAWASRSLPEALSAS